MKSRNSKFKCGGCGLNLSSQQSLQEHARTRMEVHSDPTCVNALHQCPYCHTLWPNENALSHHMRFNPTCKRIQSLPDTISKVKFDVQLSATSANTNLSCQNDNKAVSNQIISRNGNFEGMAMMNGFELSLSQGQSIRQSQSTKRKSSSHMPKDNMGMSNKKSCGWTIPSDVLSCTKEYSLRVDAIQKFISENKSSYDDTFPWRTAMFYASLLQETRQDRINVLKGTMKNLLIQIHNMSACLSLQCSGPSLPDYLQWYHFSDVKDEDIIRFVLIHDENEINSSLNLINGEGNNTQVQNHNEDDESRNEQEQDPRGTENVLVEDANRSFLEDEFEIEDDVIGNDDDLNAGNALLENVDTTMKDNAREVLGNRATACYDNCELALLELHHLLTKAGAPLYLFDEITRWCKRSKDCFQNRRVPSRQCFMKSMSEKVYGKKMTKWLQPKQVPHLLPSGKRTSITCFSFLGNLASLLMNSDIMQPQNLLLNEDNPCQAPKDSHFLKDLDSGWWFKETWDEVCTGPNEILMPIVFFLDGGKVTERLSVEPLTFTIGWLKREIRNKASSWRTIGYIESYRDESELDEEKGKKNLSSKTKLNDYHSQLDILLREFKLLQGKDSGISWNLKLGNKTYPVVFKLALQVVLGDCKGNNILCGQKGGHSLQMKKLCRDCFVSPQDADDPNHVCRFVHINDLKHKTAKELEELSMHNIENAMADVYFGARKSSIFDSTPPEPLHGIELGTLKYMYEEFEKLLSQNTLNLINSAISKIQRKYSRQSVKSMPKLTAFMNGIDRPDVLTGDNQYARFYGILLSLHDKTVFDSFAKHPKRIRIVDPVTGNEKTVMGQPLGIPKAKLWMHLIESTLAMYRWLMDDCHPIHTIRDCVNDVGEEIENKSMSSMRTYMSEFCSLIGKRAGHGLKTTKFHQLLHYHRNILKYGSVKNFDTGICEGIAVTMYKNLSRNTQRRQNNLNSQIAQRHFESIVCTEALRICGDCILKNTTGDDGVQQKTMVKRHQFSGTRFELTFHEDETEVFPTGSVNVRWFTTTENVRLPGGVSLAIAERLFLNHLEGGVLRHDSVVMGFTEYFDREGNVYRAHPNYRGDGEWFDWCLVKWDGIDEPVPARIITFLDISSCELMTDEERIAFCNAIGIDNDHPIQLDNIGYQEYLTQGLWFVVQSALSDEETPPRIIQSHRNAATSSFAKRFVLEKSYRILPVKTIAGPAYCIPQKVIGQNRNTQSFIHYKDATTWSRYFVDEY